MKFDTLINDLAKEKGWNILYSQEDDSYRLTLQTPGDRYQDVYISFRRDEEDQWCATIWSVICEVEDFNMTDPIELLRFNWRNIYGSLAVKGKQVILIQNQFAEDANMEEVNRAVHFIGFNADSIEKEIYGDRDEN